MSGPSIHKMLAWIKDGRVPLEEALRDDDWPTSWPEIHDWVPLVRILINTSPGAGRVFAYCAQHGVRFVVDGTTIRPADGTIVDGRPLIVLRDAIQALKIEPPTLASVVTAAERTRKRNEGAA